MVQNINDPGMQSAEAAGADQAIREHLRQTCEHKIALHVDAAIGVVDTNPEEADSWVYEAGVESWEFDLQVPEKLASYPALSAAFKRGFDSVEQERLRVCGSESEANYQANQRVMLASKDLAAQQKADSIAAGSTAFDHRKADKPKRTTNFSEAADGDSLLAELAGEYAAMDSDVEVYAATGPLRFKDGVLPPIEPEKRFLADGREAWITKHPVLPVTGRAFVLIVAEAMPNKGDSNRKMVATTTRPHTNMRHKPK